MLRKQSGSQGGATFGLNLKHASKKKNTKTFVTLMDLMQRSQVAGDKKVEVSCVACVFSTWGYGNKLIDFFLGQPPFMFFADISSFWASDNSFATNRGSLVC